MHTSSPLRASRIALAITLTLAALGAHAELVTATASSQDWTLNGQAALTYRASKNTVALLNATDAKVSSQDVGIAVTYRSIPRPIPMLATLAVGGFGVQGLTLDTSDRSLHGLQLSGGFSVQQETDGFTSSANGSLTISNLQVDLDQKKVFATFTGANGVGTIDRLSLFDIGTVSATPLSLAPPPVSGGTSSGGAGWGYGYGYGYGSGYGGGYGGGYVDGGSQTSTPSFGQQVMLGSLSVQLGGLSLTREGAAAWSQALAYTATGQTALASVQDWGTLGTPAVPEPGTWALMGLGLVGIASLKRRATATA